MRPTSAASDDHAAMILRGADNSESKLSSYACNKAAKSTVRSIGAPVASESHAAEAAISSGTASGRFALMPTPVTTRELCALLRPWVRMPTHLRSPSNRSLGHFSPSRTPVLDSTALRTASAAQKPTADRALAGSSDGKIVETNSPDPGGESQLRPALPRPSVWDSVTNDMPRLSLV